MMYIKKFNEDINRGYEDASVHNDPIWRKYRNNIVDIDDKIYDKISKLLINGNCRKEYSSPPKIKHIEIILLGKRGSDVIIYESIDEWFCVLIDINSKLKAFICDQEDGLLNLLRDNGIIK